MKIKDYIYFLLNPTYRAMYRMNLEFFKFKKKMPGPMIGYPLKATKEKFIWYFNYAVLNDYHAESPFRSWTVQNTWVEILSNPEFILMNLGHRHYTYQMHSHIWSRWEKLKEKYKKQLEEITFPVL